MIRRAAATLCVAGALATTSGCMTTKRATEQSATAAPENIAGPATPATTVRHAAVNDETFGELAWETGFDPYAYPDIRPGQRPSLDTMEAGLWLSTDKVERELKTAGNRIVDPKLEAYVSGIVCELAGPYCPEVRTYLVRTPAFNATMMPNGVMQVWSGLLLRTRNEAQLAAVLGHELGHFIRRHSVQQLEQMVSTGDFLVFFQLATAIGGVGAVGDLAALIATGSIYAHGRDAEREADLVGLAIMAEAGYDPREAAKVWAQLIREREASDEPQGGSVFFATHPSEDERQAYLERLAAELHQAESQTLNRARYLDHIAPWRTKFLRDEVDLGNHDTSLELLEMLEEDGFKPGEIRYFAGEVYRLRGEEKKKQGEDEESDFVRALAAYDEALGLAGVPDEVHRSVGMVHYRLEDREAASGAFATYLERVPGAVDRAVIEYMIQQSQSTTGS